MIKKAVCTRLLLWWCLLLLIPSVISSTASNECNSDDVIDLDAASETTTSTDCDTSSIVGDKNVDDDDNADDFIVTINDNDDVTCDKEEKDLNNKYKNPATFARRLDVMGLQTWTSMNSLLADLYGGRLLLVILPTPVWCNNDDNNYNKEEEGKRIQKLANEVVDMLDETFISFSSSGSSSNQLIGGINLLFGGQHDQRIQRPLIGIMESRLDYGDDNDDDYDARFINLMGNITHYPAYKFIMTVNPPLPYELKRNNNYDATTDDDDVVYDSQIQSWDYIGRKESPIEIYETIMMYWYRTYLSNTLGNYRAATMTSDAISSNDNDDYVDDDNVKPPYYTFSSNNNLLAFLQDHGEYILRPSKNRQSTMSKSELEVFDYYMRTVNVYAAEVDVNMYNDDDGLYGGIEIHNQVNNDTKEGKVVVLTDEIDPYLLVVQCRAKIDQNYDLSDDDTTSSMTADTEEQTILKENKLLAMYEFDNLAVEMVHRKDVAFFALNATDKNGRIVCGGGGYDNGLFSEREGPLSGVVAFVRIPRYVDYTIKYDGQNKKQWHLVARNVRTDWDDINNILPRAMFKPATTEALSEAKKEIHGKLANKDPMTPTQYIQTNLIAATVVHATPTVMWYDEQGISQLAFPWYRKVHAVLFVDMALSHKIPPRLDDTNNIMMNNRTSSWPTSVHYTNVTRALLYNQRLAIRMFYETARRHRKDQSNEDVVFLIVPSSEIHIMTAFGIDIWTPLDEALFGGVSFDDNARNSSGKCNMPFNVESQSTLPVMMITDSSGRYGMQAGRYYLCLDDILLSRSKANRNAMSDFVESFFNGTVDKPFVRSDTTPTSTAQQVMRKNTNRPNVTVLTGNTFESLVMDRHEEHTMLLMQASTCGHCKRFSIFWNELSSLVQVMNWSSVISVMKIDVTKNDVPHSKVNAWDLPSVYYFPANQKDEPIELPTPSSVSHNNHQYSYDEGLSWISSGFDLIKWMIEQGKLDLDLLSQLDGSSTLEGESLVDDSVK